MNKYSIGIIAVCAVALLVAVPLGLRYSQAMVLFGAIAAGAAPLVVHRVPHTPIAIGLLCGLAVFASFPVKQLFQINGLINEAAVTFVYGGLLWVIGFGWKRKWQ